MPNEENLSKIVAAEDKFRGAIREYHNTVAGGSDAAMISGFSIVYEYLDTNGESLLARYHDEDSTLSSKYGRTFFADTLDRTAIAQLFS